MPDDHQHRLRRRPRDRAAFPTDLPMPMQVPPGVSAEAYAINRRLLSVLMGRFMTTRLRSIYQAFDGDLTLALVLGELSMRNIESLYPPHASINRLAEQAMAPQREGARRLRPCNALSIAEVTGIPRETVRRKLGKLLDLGWIERTTDDMYVITDKVGAVFSAFDDSQAADLLTTSEQIREVLATSRPA
ncbi:MAG: Crp/Fnr family transcriptional regulator [Burkholderiaceae bacterium]